MDGFVFLAWCNAMWYLQGANKLLARGSLYGKQRSSIDYNVEIIRNSSNKGV